LARDAHTGLIIERKRGEGFEPSSDLTGPSVQFASEFAGP